MGSAAVQGDLWGRAPRDWADLQEAFHAPLWEAMLDSAGVGPGSRVLDAGCGSGGACSLARARGAAVVGLDASEPLIALARNRIPGAEFKVGDLEELPFDDGVFDGVIAASSIQYADSPSAAAKELGRVCAVSGRVSVGLWNTPERVDFEAMFEAVGNALPTPPEGDGPFALSAPGLLESLIEETGMRLVETGEADCPFDYPDFTTFWRASLSAGPLQAALRVVDRDILEAAVADAIRPFQRADGRVRFENSFRFVTGTWVDATHT